MPSSMLFHADVKQRGVGMRPFLIVWTEVLKNNTHGQLE